MRSVFGVAASVGLARLPLLPVTESDGAERELLAEAIFLASRQADLAALDTDRPAERFAALRAYEVRARARPTPHGGFAGVAAIRFAREPASLQLADRHAARTYPSGAWLAEVATRLVDDPCVWASLTATSSGLVVRRGSRYEVERSGTARMERVTIRATKAVAHVLGRCASRAPLKRVAAETAARFEVPQEAVDSMLRELVRNGFLLIDLLPEDVTADPLRHLLDRLPADSPMREAVRELRRFLAEADGRPPGDAARLAALRAARDTADGIVPVERPLVADVRADALLALPVALAEQAARAASLLWAIGAARDPLTRWHAQFLHRYGAGRAVPLLDAVDPVIGLGTDIPVDDERPEPGRLAALSRLVADAIANGRVEVTIDPDSVRELEDGRGGELPPRTAEIFVRVLADVGGQHFLAVCGAAADAGATRGRFTGLLPPAPVDIADEPWMVAELLTAPARGSGAALAPPTGQARYRIPVGVPVRDGDLLPEELHLISDGQRLAVWSARHDIPVIPVLYSRVAPHLLPPLARFLQLAGHAGSRPLRPWSWGPVGLGPFQPRIRYDRTILTPARWVLPLDLTRASRDQTAWDEALRTWRSAATPAPPRIVLVDDADRRLPLDLDWPEDRDLLRRYVRRGARAVTEQPGGSEADQAVVTGPGGNHVLEVVVPLRRRAPMPQPPRSAVPARSRGAGLHLPGGPWLSLVIPAPAPCQDYVLAEIAAVADGLACCVDRWFWLRYTTPAHGPHLRVRFHGAPATLGGRVLPAIARRCTEMITLRLCGRLSVEPYDQEIERYGGPCAITAAERVFAADSALVLQILSATADPDQRLLAAAVAAARIARTVAGGNIAALAGRHVDRAARRRLATLRPPARVARKIPHTDDAIAADWNDALAAYRALLPPDLPSACASSLIHMHANRLLGDTALEPLARALAADLLAAP